MASAWGSSWGAFWGNSWGSVGAVVTPPAPEVGGPIVGGTFSRGKWREHKRKKDEEWRLAVEAQERAEERALELTQKKQQKAYEAAQLADRAITLAAAEERIGLAKLTIALNAAVSAQKVTAFMRGMSQVDIISRAIIRQIEEEQDEEDAIALLLSSL